MSFNECVFNDLSIEFSRDSNEIIFNYMKYYFKDRGSYFKNTGNDQNSLERNNILKKFLHEVAKAKNVDYKEYYVTEYGLETNYMLKEDFNHKHGIAYVECEFWMPKNCSRIYHLDNSFVTIVNRIQE